MSVIPNDEVRVLEVKRIGRILADLQVLTPAEVDRVLAAMRCRRDRCKFGQVAREMNLLSEEHILAALAVQMELFPRICDLPLRRILETLSGPGAPATASAKPMRLTATRQGRSASRR